MVLPGAAATPTEVMQNFPVLTNLYEVRHAVSGNMGCICAYALEGVVLAADSESGTIFLQDSSGTEILETPLTGQALQPGQVIRLCGTNYLTATESGASLGRDPVVGNDGLHSKCCTTATLYLQAGRHPIQVSWFNNIGDWFLEVAYAGPGFARRTIPDSALFHAEATTNGTLEFAPGLNYQCYEGDWKFLPRFESLKPVKAGITGHFTPEIKTRNEYVGLAFSGFVEVDTNGPFTFYLTSDDGSQLFLNNTAPPRLTVTGTGAVPQPEEVMVKQPVPSDRGPLWAEVEGQITFIGSQQNNQAELELTSDDARMRVVVHNAGGELRGQLLGARVRLRGVCLAAANGTGHQLVDTLVIPNWKSVPEPEIQPEVWSAARNVKMSAPEKPGARSESNSLPTLTTAAQVQQLTREAAQRGYPVKLKGVVTWVSEHHDCVVLQDETRGVFVGLRDAWTFDTPKPGDILEIEGKCVPAEFSPIVILSHGERVGRGLLPAPMHPTWDQLIGGSLDDQYIEIAGLATSSQDENHLTLLMPGGKKELEFFPRPVAPLAAFVNSVVRIRGVMFANWEISTHMVTPSRPLRFGSATICTDVPPPADPFTADRMHARELMQFDVRRNTFQRVKVLGQCLCNQGGLWFMTDDGFGFRVEPVQPVQVEPGDMLDVVGLVELGGASPVLREAIARKISRLPLPVPEPLAFEQTNNLHDSTRVWAAGVLLGVKDAGSERVLEMQSGLNHFSARLPANARAGWPAGSRLKLTGTLSAVGANSSDGQHLNAIELLLNSPADVELIARPSWWTLERLLLVVAILTLGLALAFIWISLLRAQVERRSVQLRREISERQRAEQERAIERERSRIALDLHDDLGSRLTGISMLATTGQGSKPSAETSRERLQLIADKARLMVTTLDGLVWAVDPKNDTVASLAEYLASFTEEFLARTGIACTVELPHEFPNRTVAAEARHNVLLAVREALNNAVRHGHPGEVRLQLTCADHALAIVLRDDGCGFDVEKITPGNGLANLRARLHKANGSCRIESSPGHGTTVLLTLSY